MELTLPVHAVLGGEATLRGEAAAPWAFRLPDGSLSATRFLTGGQSAAKGWPVICEALAEGRFLMLHLGLPELSLSAVADELDPTYSEGFPRLGQILSDLEPIFSAFRIGLKPGTCLLLPQPDEDISPILPKLTAQARKLGFQARAVSIQEAESPHFAARLSTEL